jgi:hypothetical protein
VGRAMSLLSAKRLRGLICPSTPTGVSHIRTNQPNQFCSKTTIF